jgi:hypothetical protein
MQSSEIHWGKIQNSTLLYEAENAVTAFGCGKLPRDQLSPG